MPKRLGRSMTSIAKQCERIHNEIVAGLFTFLPNDGEPVITFDDTSFSYVLQLPDGTVHQLKIH